ncbi:MAG: exodeoxyribonuclease VII small subunit [Clostridiales bacterium]|nr:exodeoxyribonuclease VII small subunit [Clostridiales bacterium]
MNENIKYEDALKLLEQITEKLELGDNSLEESLKLFEQGTKLCDICYKQLENARQKVTEITQK